MARKKFDPRPTIRVVTTMPDHPKIAPLSDAAFRAMVTLWCWCGEHHTDGHIPTAIATKKASRKAVAELVTAGLLRVFKDGYGVHDYDEHQRMADEIDALRQAASESGAKGAHLRWHVPQRKVVPECQFCEAQVKEIGNA